MATLKKVADFISEGPGVWYDVQDDKRIIFYDSADDFKERGYPLIKTFRYV